MPILQTGASILVHCSTVKCGVCGQTLASPFSMSTILAGSTIQVTILPIKDWQAGHISARLEPDLSLDELITKAVSQGWKHIPCPDNTPSPECVACPILICPNCFTLMSKLAVHHIT